MILKQRFNSFRVPKPPSIHHKKWGSGGPPPRYVHIRFKVFHIFVNERWVLTSRWCIVERIFLVIKGGFSLVIGWCSLVMADILLRHIKVGSLKRYFIVSLVVSTVLFCSLVVGSHIRCSVVCAQSSNHKFLLQS